MKRICFLAACLLLRGFSASAQTTRLDSVPCDTLSLDSLALDTLPHDSRLLDLRRLEVISLDSLQPLVITPVPSTSFFKKVGGFVKHIVDLFDDINPDYIERVGYNFTGMLQATTNFERYTISLDDYSQYLSFRQRPDLRFGPYFGWRWIFLGYTYDFTSIGKSQLNRGSKFEFSLYSSMVGIDLMWRRTGTDFYLRKVSGLGEDAEKYEGTDISNYISSNITGANIYYIFNHRKFSHPAIFSQSTIQRRSAGSWQLGFGVTVHDIHFDYKALPQDIFKGIVENQYETLERIKYVDYSLSAGYGYNWVFARGWCFGISLMPALGYKWASAQTALLQNTENTESQGGSFSEKIDEIFRKRGNINLDITGRAGLIYNTGRWFVGLFGIVHNYNYRRDEILFTNVFGNINLCGGFYFQKRHFKD